MADLWAAQSGSGEEERELVADGLTLRFRLPDSRDLAAVVGSRGPVTACDLLARRCVLEASRDGTPVAGRVQANKDGLVGVGFDNPIKRGRYDQGFDDVMKKGPNLDIGEVYVVEYKGGESRLAKGQMELDWIIGNIRRLYTEGGPDGQAWARILAKALREGRLKGIAYSTPLIGNAPQPTQTIKTWTYEARNLKLL